MYVNVLFYVVIEFSITSICLTILDILFTKTFVSKFSIHVLYTLQYVCCVYMSMYVLNLLYVRTYVHTLYILVIQLDRLSK